MSEEAKQVKRKQISKRVRFEVFKRDGFKYWSDWQFMIDDAIQSSISYGGGNV